MKVILRHLLRDPNYPVTLDSVTPSFNFAQCIDLDLLMRDTTLWPNTGGQTQELWQLLT